jgi:hypothetical protein
MAKRALDKDALEFGERLVGLLRSRDIQRRGAGKYLADRYKVSTVTANDWLNGQFKPNTSTARRIAEDHGSTFDALYFGVGDLSTGLPPEASQPVRHQPRTLARTAKALKRFLARREMEFDVTDELDAELLLAAVAEYEKSRADPEPDDAFSFALADLVQGYQARRNERGRGSEQDHGAARAKAS